MSWSTQVSVLVLSACVGAVGPASAVGASSAVALQPVNVVLQSVPTAPAETAPQPAPTAKDTPSGQDSPSAPPARGRAQRPAAEAGDEARDLPQPEDWRALIARDAALQFNERSGARARATLLESNVPPERRAVALFALGESGAPSERERLMQVARSAVGLERRAAVLALGELDAGADSLLIELSRSDDDALAACALLGLLRQRPGAGRRHVEEIASDPTHRLHAVAADLLIFAVDPPASRPTRAAWTWLRLRWEAAREYGLVQEQTWPVLVVREMARDPVFVRTVVLTSAAALRRPGTNDLLLPELLEGKGLARVTVAVAAMPREVSQLVAAGLWAPADDAEWTSVLDTIDERRFERLSVELLRAAVERPTTRARGLAALARIGDPTLKSEIVEALPDDPSRVSVEDRWLLADTLGSLRDPKLLARWSSLSEDKDARVRMAYATAALRRDDRAARVELEGILEDTEHADHNALVVVLTRAARDPLVGLTLEERLPNARGEEQVRIAEALCLEGRLVGRSVVREALAAVPAPSGARAARLVRALRKNVSAEDLEIFQKLFPRPDDPQLNRELAFALVELNDPLVTPLLRAGLWKADFNVSLLSAGLLCERGGVRVLRDELKNPPNDVFATDMRRVGFAVGLWGGIEEVEILARERRHASGDPALQGALLGAFTTRTQ